MKNLLPLFIAATLLCGCYKRNLEPTVSGSSILSTISLRYKSPNGLVADKHGNVFISYGFIIGKIDNNKKYTIIAGGGTVTNYDGMPATVATLYADGLAIDAQDNIYFTDRERNRITKVDPQGIAHIIAGPIIQDSVRLPEDGFGGDGGPATNALMNWPAEIAVDGNGNVYFNDEGNYRIRKVNAQGIISTVTGGGTAVLTNGSMAVDGRWISTYAMIVDKQNNLYVGYFGSDIIKITPEGRVSLVAGGKDLGYTPDGSKAMGAKLGWVYGLAFDANDHLYFSEYDNHRIRMIDGLGILRTVAGSGIDTTSYKFDCPALQATVSNPQSICFDAYNNMYIISDKYDAVLKVSK